MVELRQIVGKANNGSIVEHDVDSVIFGGEEVGIVGRFDGANVAMIVELSTQDRKQLEAGVNKARAEQGYTIPCKLHGHPIPQSVLSEVMSGGDE